jgi:hypothetical protein
LAGEGGRLTDRQTGASYRPATTSLARAGKTIPSNVSLADTGTFRYLQIQIQILSDTDTEGSYFFEGFL